MIYTGMLTVAEYNFLKVLTKQLPGDGWNTLYWDPHPTFINYTSDMRAKYSIHEYHGFLSMLANARSNELISKGKVFNKAVYMLNKKFLHEARQYNPLGFNIHTDFLRK